MPEKRKVIVNQKRDVRTYAELWLASKKVLESGLREPVGSWWQFLSSLLLTAFAFEAYMNHVGPTVLSCWKSLERRMSPWRKLDRLCEVLDVKGVCDKDKRPGETIWRLFDFRNKLAHGRTHTIECIPRQVG